MSTPAEPVQDRSSARPFWLRYRFTWIAIVIGAAWLASVLVPWLSGSVIDSRFYSLVRAPVLVLASALLWRAANQQDLARLRLGWRLIAASVLMIAAGEALWSIRYWRTGIDTGLAASDAFYLSYFPLLLAGLFVLPRQFASRTEQVRFALDCAIVAIGGGLAVWHFGLHAALRSADFSRPLAATVTIAYPIGDLVTLVAIAATLLKPPSVNVRRTFTWLAAALAASLFGDLAWTGLQLSGQTDHPLPAQSFWFAQAVLLTAVAESLGRSPGLAPPHRPERVAWLPNVALLAGYFLIGSVALRPEPAASLPSLLAFGGLLTACIVVREFVANRENTELAREHERLSSESRLAKLIENAADGIFVLDGESRTVYVSPSAARLLHLPMKQMVGQPIARFLQADDAESLRSLLASLDTRSGRRGAKLMLRFAPSEGGHAWTETTVTDERDDPNLAGVVLNVRDVTEHNRLEQEVQHQALHDALTQLPNRELFLDRVARALAAGSERKIAVAVLDLDQFRLVNDSLGHGFGDQVIVLVAERLKGALRASDTLARLSADEFAMMFDDVGDSAVLNARLDRVLQAFQGSFRIGRHSLRLTAGIGVALPRGLVSAPDLLRDADTAVSTAKQQGQNRFHVFEPLLHTQVVERLAVQASIPEALESGQFLVHLQPVVGLVDGYPIGLRPRLRWRDPAQAPFPIERVREIVQDAELALRLGDWVLATAQREFQSLLRYQHGASALSLLMPIDARHVHHPDLVSKVSTVLDSLGLPAVNLTIAVSEEALGNDREEALRPLRQLRALGVRLALARFGSRASSLAVLHEPLFDVLILSRSLAQGLRLGGRSHTLVRGVVAMAEALGVRVVATGVDSSEIRDALSELGCLYGIGAALAQPMPLESLLPWLGARLGDAR